MEQAGGMKISAVIITYNEEDRLPDALASLQGVADEIVVVDSYSTDRTAGDRPGKPGPGSMQNRFEDYGQQKNFAMAKSRAANGYSTWTPTKGCPLNCRKPSWN